MDTTKVADSTTKINYDDIIDLNDLGGVLRQFRRLHSGEEMPEELVNICRNWFDKIGALDDFDPTDINSLIRVIDGIGEGSKLHEEEINEGEFGSKTPGPEELAGMLDNYDEYVKRNGDSKDALRRIIAENPMFKRQTVEDLINAKMKLVAKGAANPNKIATKAEVIKEEVREKTNKEITSDEAVEIAEAIVESKNEEAAVKELKGKVPEELVEEVLKPIVVEEMVEREMDAVGQKIEDVVETTAEEIVKELKEDFPGKEVGEEIDGLKGEIKNRVEESVKTTIKLDDLVEGKTLTNIIVGGLKISAPEEINKVAGEVRNGSIKITKEQAFGELGKNIDKFEKSKEWLSVYSKILDKKKADLVVEVGHVSIKEQLIVEQALKDNGYSPANVDGNRAPIIKNYLKVGRIGDTVKQISGVRDKLKDTSIFKKIDPINRLLEKSPVLTRSLGEVQRLLNMRNMMYRAVGWGAEKFGISIGFEGLKEWGMQLATKLGAEEVVTAMSTHFAAFGFEGGLQSILSQLLSKGVITPVAEGLVEGTVLTTEAAVPVAGWIVAAVTWLAIEGTKLVFKGIKKAWSNVSETLNIGNTEWQNDLGWLGSAAVTGIGTVGLGMSLLGSFLVSAVGLIAVPAVLAVIFVGLVIVPAGYNLYQMDSVFLPRTSNLVQGLGGGGGGSNGSNFNYGTNGKPIPGSMIPATPIYDDKCVQSVAWCVADYLVNNGAVYINKDNVEAAENLINQWKNAPPGFDKKHFNTSMYNSATYVDGHVFQCVGFAVAVNWEIGFGPGNSDGWGGDHASWDEMIRAGSPTCPRIDPSGAGAGDFILFPVVTPTFSWYHIQVLSRLRPDGSFSISQANWGGPGRVSNEEHAAGTLQDYLKDKAVLRCK